MYYQCVMVSETSYITVPDLDFPVLFVDMRRLDERKMGRASDSVKKVDFVLNACVRKFFHSLAVDFGVLYTDTVHLQ